MLLLTPSLLSILTALILWIKIKDTVIRFNIRLLIVFCVSSLILVASSIISISPLSFHNDVRSIDISYVILNTIGTALYTICISVYYIPGLISLNQHLTDKINYKFNISIKSFLIISLIFFISFELISRIFTSSFVNVNDRAQIIIYYISNSFLLLLRVVNVNGVVGKLVNVQGYYNNWKLYIFSLYFILSLFGISFTIARFIVG